MTVYVLKQNIAQLNCNCTKFHTKIFKRNSVIKHLCGFKFFFWYFILSSAIKWSKTELRNSNGDQRILRAYGLWQISFGTSNQLHFESSH